MLTTVGALSSQSLPQRQRPRAIVIGSGFGGLAAAIRLGARGYHVTILEKLDQPGGRASVFRQDGFIFDAGPTIITLPHLFEELWSLAGRRIEDDVDLRPLDPFYRIRFHDGGHFDCSGDPQHMRSEVARLSPDDVEGYERFLKESEAIFRLGFEQLGDVPFNSLATMIQAVPGLVRYRADRSVYQMVSRYLTDERLRFAFSFHPLFVGGNPFRVSSVYSLVSYLEHRWGVHFAMGGMGSLVNGLVRLIEGQGGILRCGAEVAEITVENRTATGVRLASGETLTSDIVVSNADSAWMFENLLPGIKRRRWSSGKIQRARHSMGLFVWYFGTNRTYPDVGHHTILLGPRYRELLEDIFDRKILAEDFSLYLHRPTATDPSLAPDGCDTFYVLSPVPHLDAEIDWREQAEPYRKRIETALAETLLPGLDEAVISSKLMTPLDFQDRLLSYKGAAFGLEPVLTQSAWFRPHNQCEEVDKLYLVGAGTHPGAGVPGVLMSARVLDKVVPHGNAVV